jgi:hypothetical protein
MRVQPNAIITPPAIIPDLPLPHSLADAEAAEDLA